jgi:cobalt-zinc-cadmium efflux system protein
MGHSHESGGHSGQSHSAHDHAGPAAGRRPRLIAALAISGTILVAEVIGAFLTGSLALLTDAAHMLTDVAGLSLALLASILAGRPADDRRPFGYRRAEVLSAAVQALFLLAVGVFVLIEAVRRLADPPDVAASGLLIFGGIGLAGNLLAISILASHRRADMNLRAAFLEVANDALGSAAVLVAAAVIAATGFARADPIASLAIAALIMPRSAALLRDAVHVLLEATPKSVQLDEVRQHLLGVPHVREVHDLHITTVATDLPILSAHVVVEDRCFMDGHAPALLDELQSCVAGHFDVEHSTFQLEPAGHAAHEQTPDH